MSNPETVSTHSDPLLQEISSYTISNQTSIISPISSAQPEKSISEKKTVEDRVVAWIQAVGPILVSVVLGILTYQQAQTAEANRLSEVSIAKSNQQHEIMSSYLEQMTKLLLEENLRNSKAEDEIRTVARSITLNAARQLDSSRKGQLLKFLYEADLIGGCEPGSAPFQTGKCNAISILNLNEAKLEETRFDRPVPLPGINLENVVLSKAELPKIDLTKAIMNNAVLTGTTLDGAYLTDAKLRSAKLDNADLEQANLFRANLIHSVLTRANLTGASLEKADLRCAELQGAILTNAKLAEAKFKNAKYDAQTVFPQGFVAGDHGMIRLSYGSKAPTCIVE